MKEALCPICSLECESTKHIIWSCPSAMDVCKECEKKFQKSTYYSLDYLQVVEEMFKKCDMKEFELFVNI